MLSRGWTAYCEGDSIVHKLHPSLKIFGLFCFLLLCVLKYNNYLFIANITIVFILVLFSNVDIVLYFKKIWKMKFLLIILYFVLYRLGMSITNINVLMFKIVFFVLYWNVIKYTTTRLDISKGIANIFNVFNFLGYNIRKLVIKLSNLFSSNRFFSLSSNEYVNSLDVRGDVYSQSNIVSKVRKYFTNYSEIIKEKRNKKKERRASIDRHLYNKKRIVSFKYLYRYKFIDYLFGIIYIVMITFYILKVR